MTHRTTYTLASGNIFIRVDVSGLGWGGSGPGGIRSGWHQRAKAREEFCAGKRAFELIASMVSVFPTLDPDTLIEGHKLEFGPRFIFSKDPDHCPLKQRGTPLSASNLFFVGVQHRSYLCGNLRTRSSFRVQLLLPSALRYCSIYCLQYCNKKQYAANYISNLNSMFSRTCPVRCRYARYGYECRTEITKASGTGIYVVPNLPKYLVPAWKSAPVLAVPVSISYQRTEVFDTSIGAYRTYRSVRYRY